MSGLVAVVVARMGSARLRGKAMLPIMGRPMLARMIERIRCSKHVGRIVVATTTAPEDDAIEDLAGELAALGVACHRGSEEDVLGRLDETLRAHPGPGALQLLGDNPLVHSSQIDAVCERYLAGGLDYVVTVAPELPGAPEHLGRFPTGVRVEAFAPSVIARCARSTEEPYHREHATSFIYQNPGSFRIGYLGAPAGASAPADRSFSLAVNYRGDYELVRRVFERLYPRQANFPLSSVISLLESDSRLADLTGASAGTGARS